MTCRRKRGKDAGTAKVKHTIRKRGRSKWDKVSQKHVRVTAAVQEPAAQVPAKEYASTYNSSDMQQLLGVLAIREQRALRNGANTSRSGKQLSAMGKITQVQRKYRGSVPDAFVDRLPRDHAFTCVAVFESILRGEFEPLYDSSGRVQRTIPPTAADSD